MTCIRQTLSIVVFCSTIISPLNHGIAQEGVTVPASSASATQMAIQARAFLSTLDDSQRDQVMFPLDSDERGRWSNLPASSVPRSGLRIGSLSEAQRIALHELLRASMSSQGYLKVSGVMHSEQISRDISASPPPDLLGIDTGLPWPGPMSEFSFEDFEWMPEFLSELERVAAAYKRSLGELESPAVGDHTDYFISIFGLPEQSGDWAWLLGGHHLAASFTVASGKVGVTPLFLGSAPLTVRRGSEAGWSPLPHEAARGFELMQALTQEQKRMAVLSSERVYDVIAGPGRRDSLANFEGLKATEMTVGQRWLLRVLVEEFVRNADFDAAEAHLDVIDQAGWEEIWFSWRGPVDDADDLFYYRVHGPRILIELAWEAWNHVHTIVRDPGNDYGEDWLGQHYTEQHPDTSRLRNLAREGMDEMVRIVEEQEAPATDE